MNQKHWLSIILFSFSLLCHVSCGGDEIIDNSGQVEPKPALPEYKLVSIDFTPDTKDNFIPVEGKEEVLYFQNSGNIIASRTYLSTLQPKDTSLFYAPKEALPEGNNINEILVRVPKIDCTPLIQGLTPHTYLFAFGKEQEHIQPTRWVEQVVRIAPHTQIKIAERKDGYRIKASYHAVLENVHSGERMEINGRWEGTQLVSGNTVLTEEKTE
ncbi:MAG: hypothetical protein RRZ65_07750 [Tannerellaceae bacterium]